MQIFSVGGAYHLKNELFPDMLTVLSGLTELTKRLEFEGKEVKELCYVM